MESILSQDQDPDPENVIKLLVASDIHLGYDENNAVRGEDSFVAFEEVLQHAVNNNVDAILLGGDLFHLANPSVNSVTQCSRLLKKYTFGDKPIKLELLSDASKNFPDSHSGTVSYDDPDLNVGIPVFSIHGNHDDPSSFGRISSMDLLSGNGYVNYFGKWTDLNKINISPILLRKGETKLALYGLGHIGDARLCRMFEMAKVMMDIPEDTGWFNVLVLHQNRADRGPKNYLPESALPSLLDLVIWGHEHDCRIIPETNSTKKFFVSQPGSTVATSLSEGESIQKCCGLLRIHKGCFHMEPIPLKTVRPFVFESVDLATVHDELRLDEGNVQQKVHAFATERIEALMERAKAQLTDNERQPKLPLIRLRLQITDNAQQFNAIRFGQGYIGIVANPLDMVVFKKHISHVKSEHVNVLDKKALEEAYRNQQEHAAHRAEEIVERYFREADLTKQMEIMCPRALAEFVRRMVDHEDDDAADRILEFYEKNALKFLESQDTVTDDNVDEVLAALHEKNVDLYDEMLAMLDSHTQKTSDLPARSRPLRIDDDDAIEKPSTNTAAGKSKRGRSCNGARGSGGAEARKTTRGARGGRKAASAKANDSTSSSRSQVSISSMFSQQSSNIPSVAARTSARKTTTQRARQMSFDSD